MFWKTGPPTRSFSSPRAAQCGGPLQQGPNSEPPVDRLDHRPHPGDAPRCGRHRRCQRRDRRRCVLDGLRASSRERLLERFAAALTGDQDAAVSDRPRDRAADPRMSTELAVPFPHGPLRCERQLVTTTPTLDIDQLTACQATERDRSRPPPVASATQKRDDRDRRATALKLLPHSLASRQLPTASRTGRPTAPCRSGTGAPARRAQRATSGPDSGASETNTDPVGSESQAPPSSTGTTHPAMPGGRSPGVPSAGRRARSRAPRGIRGPEAAPKPGRVGPHPSTPKMRLQRPSLDVVVCSIGPVNADSRIYWPKETSACCPRTNLQGRAFQGS
jgi:hypothetical protein